MSLSAEEDKKLFSFLRSENCCLRCCLRFIGWRTVECYQEPVEFVKRMKYIDVDDDLSLEESPCVACLGILQQKSQEEAVQRIQQEVEKERYDCDTFTCQLGVPISVRLRDRLLLTRCITELNFSESALSNFKTKIQNSKDIWKWLIVPKLEEVTKKRAESTLPSPFLIEVFLTYDDDDKECEALLSIFKKASNTAGKQKRKSNDNKFSRKNVELLMAEITDEQFAQCLNILVMKPSKPVKVGKVECSHSSIFIGGRYNKLSRKISQTPWFINGEKKMETSVQDILCNPVAKAIKAQSIKFLSSGREDVDVRNIYSGRPFAVELINPRMTNITPQLLSDLVSEINLSTKQVQIVSDLKVLSRLDLKKLKEGENVKTKFYRALCVCRTASKNSLQLDHLNKLKRVKIVQKTPVRVLHRRPLSPRTRLIYEMRARWARPAELKRLLLSAGEEADQFFVLDVKTQAGTYVKEFVHGDFGRTTPSLCDLLKTEVDIVALDVTGINLNWP